MNGTNSVVSLGSEPLTLADYFRVVGGSATARLSDEARATMTGARTVLLEVVANNDAVYGTTTAVAERKRVTVLADRQAQFNRDLIEGHRTAQGPTASRPLTRATLVCLANGLARGFSGVRPEVVDTILDALEGDQLPSMRTLGSLGEADIGPLADLAHGLLAGKRVELQAGEALALLNNNAFATGATALALHRARTFLDTADAAAAFDIEAFGANLGAWHEIVADCSGLAGVGDTVRHVREVLAGSVLWEPGRARNLQDPMSFRCIPQIHGAARNALAYATTVVETSIGAFQNNPVVVAGERRVISAGNFDATALSAAADFLRLALAPVISAAAERTVKLLQATTSGLAPGLAEAPELGEDGLAELAITVQSLAVEARTLAHPVSHEPASSFIAEGIEDRSTMAPLSARRLDQMIDFAAAVTTLELVIAAQAVDLRGWQPLGQGTARVHALVRAHVPFTAAGTAPPQHLAPLQQAVDAGQIGAAAGPKPEWPPIVRAGPTLATARH